jgi:hypothetical protein
LLDFEINGVGRPFSKLLPPFDIVGVGAGQKEDKNLHTVRKSAAGVSMRKRSNNPNPNQRRCGLQEHNQNKLRIRAMQS